MKKSDTKPRFLSKAEINVVSGGNGKVLDAVGQGMAKGFGDAVKVGDTVYFPPLVITPK